MIARWLVLATGAATGFTSVAADGATSQQSIVTVPETSPAEDPFAVQFDLRSKSTGRTYRIFLHRPATPPPSDGWPVIYVLDSRSSFGTASSQVFLRTSTGQRGAVVVGIGYPDAAAAGKLRFYDLTPFVPPPSMVDELGMESSDFGGAALFHRFMIDELRPVIAAMTTVDIKDQSLIGYSLGGLFALNVLFDDPEAYRTIVASSPSIWWNNRELLKKEPAFASAVEAGRVTTRVLITSNMWEQYPPDDEQEADPGGRQAGLPKSTETAMVDNARALAERLGALNGADGYRVRFVLFPEETHLTGIPAAISRGVRFTFTR